MVSSFHVFTRLVSLRRQGWALAILQGHTTSVFASNSSPPFLSRCVVKIILDYKYRGGPMLIFWLEFGTFTLLYVIVSLLTTASPNLALYLLGLVITAYFTSREIVQM